MGHGTHILAEPGELSHARRTDQVCVATHGKVLLGPGLIAAGCLRLSGTYHCPPALGCSTAPFPDYVRFYH